MGNRILIWGTYNPFWKLRILTYFQVYVKINFCCCLFFELIGTKVLTGQKRSDCVNVARRRSLLNRFLTTLTGSFLSRTGPPILAGWAGLVRRCFWLGNHLQNWTRVTRQYSPVSIFRVPNTPVSEFLSLDVSRQIVLGFLSKYEKGKTVTKW